MGMEVFQEKTKDAEPHKNVVWFLKQNVKPGIAVDLGCGSGRDSVILLKNGWEVYSYDADDTAHYILERTTEEEQKRFHFHQGYIQDVEIPKCDLVVANYSMHYISRDEFKKVIDRISNSLNPDGYFLGVIVGEKDSWAEEYPDKAYLSQEELEEIMMSAKFQVKTLKANEYEGKNTTTGQPKHWHELIVVSQALKRDLTKTKVEKDEER